MTWKLLAIVIIACQTVVIFALVFRYDGILDEVRSACAQTSAAGKLDISSFVPLCGKVKP